MQVLDDRGRIFGKVNIIDAAVLVFVGLLIPLAYGAYLLFRTPQAQVLALEPTRVSPTTTEVMVRGQHLRPYLRMFVGDQPGTFFFGTPNEGILRLPRLLRGTYDVVLYDERRELGRLNAALVISDYPYEERVVKSAGLFAIGSFRGLDLDGAKELSRQLETLSQRTMPWGTIRGFQNPESNFQLTVDNVPVIDGTYQIRAVLLLDCDFRDNECQLQDRPVKSGNPVAIDVGGESVRFLVEEVHPTYDNRVEVIVRTVLTPTAVNLLGRDPPAAAFPARDALRPTYVSFEPLGTRGDGATIGLVRLQLPALRIRDGWHYGTGALRLGGEFSVSTPLYVVAGTIVNIRSVGPLRDPS